MGRKNRNDDIPPHSPDRDELRLPPADLATERFVLGSALASAEHLATVVAVPAACFSLESNRRIHARMCDMAERGEVVDRVTLVDALRKYGQLESVGGMTAILELEEGLPQMPAIDSYVGILREFAGRRKLIALGQAITENAYRGEQSPAEILEAAEPTWREVEAGGTQQGDGGQTPEEVIQSFPGGLSAFLDPSQRLRGLPTGFSKFDEMTGGMKPGEVIILAARPSHGKAQPLHSSVKIPGGWRRIGDLKVGEAVQAPDGSTAYVSGVFPQGIKPILRVTFRDGRSTLCCREHLWQVFYRDWPEDRVLTTEKITDMLKRKRYRSRMSIPMPNGDFGQQQPPIDPWLLGYLLGDGALTSVTPSFTTADSEVVTRIKNIAGRYGCTISKNGNLGHRIRYTGKRTNKPNQISDILKSLGLLGHRAERKFIPQICFEMSRYDRFELLRGLFDSDGTAGSKGQVSFCTVSKRLAEDVQQLVRSLGGMASIGSKNPVYEHNGEKRKGQRAYILGVILKDTSEAFWLKRKINKATKRLDGRQQRLNITSVEPAGHAECVCIAVTHPSQTYITDQFTVTHNSAIALNIAQHLVTHPKQRRYVAFFSLEMSSESLILRMACAGGRVDLHKFRAGFLNQDERYRLQVALDEIVHSRIRFYDSTGITMAEIAAAIRKQVEDGGLHLAIIDYLQLIQSHGESENRNQEVSKMSRQLKMLANEVGIPIIVLSQLSRQTDRRGDPRPVLSDLRDSGSLEQDADLVAFVFREEMHKRDREDLRGLAELIIAKQRNGPIGAVPLRFLNQYTRFENRAEDLAEPEGGD